MKTIAAAVGGCADLYPIDEAYVFGSYARSEQDAGSDVDLCIECGDGFSLFMLGGVGNRLEQELGVPVDIVCGEHTFFPKARERYLKDRVLVYARL